MEKYEEIEGDLIALAKKGTFDVIAHGCNCQCVMGAGIAPQMAKAFAADRFAFESIAMKGVYDKLGRICYGISYVKEDEEPVAYLGIKTHPAFEMTHKKLYVVNAYTQYDTGKDLDYTALRLCLRKINRIFKGSHIGLPQIGCGLAGGDWNIVKPMIQEELKDCQVTVVIYKQN